MYSLLSRIRLSSSAEVLATADRMVKEIVLAYFQPNLSPEGIRSRALDGEDDPLREFSEVCRTEIEKMQEHL